ncbi:hypothetical protein D3C87_1576670 [compost metagenome]
MHRTFVLAELRQQRLDLLRGKIRIQCTSPPPQPHAIRCLSGIATHAAAQAHDGRIVCRLEVRVVPQNRLKHLTIQRVCLYRLLQPCSLVDAEAQGCSLRIRQRMQHRGIHIVRTVQVLIAVVPSLVFAILIQDQHFADRCVDGAQAVGQRSPE